MEGLDAPTRAILENYVRAVRELPNESAKTHRFAALVGELFPGSNVNIEVAQGIEKRLRIDLGTRKKTGRIDAYFGNAVIEFEKTLAATHATALQQLKEYAAGVWAEEQPPYRRLLCIATDGIYWETFLPRYTGDGKSAPTPAEIELDELREFVVTPQTLYDFWLSLTSLLFRDQRTFPTADRFQFDFGLGSPAYTDATAAILSAWETVSATSECQLAFETWKKYLSFTYGQVADEGRGSTSELHKLFFKHTYLACLARLLVWAALSGGKTKQGLGDTAQSVFAGEYFEQQGIQNLVEDDFFQWVRRPSADAHLRPVWEKILTQLQTYDLQHINQDVLKNVYQQLVDPKDRHDLGEYYTPEWLCERIITEVLPAEGYYSVLDPTCGSGSFLRAAIAHLLASNPDGGNASRLQSILNSVAGIDIHPLAVTISKTTYVLALHSLIKASKRPIQIPVYLADSLFLPTEVAQMRLGEVPGYAIRFGDRTVSMPYELIRSPDIFDRSISACSEVAVDHAESVADDENTLRRYLENEAPQLFKLEQADQIVAALWQFTEELSDLIRQRQNSIWAFIVRNAYRPAMLRDRFDFIVGNPPWLSYRYIADPEYQAEVKKRLSINMK